MWLKLVVVFCLLFAVKDWADRILVQEEATQAAQNDSGVKPSVPVSLTELQADAILSRFSQYIDQALPKAEVIKELALDFQRNQEGELSSLFSGNKKLELKAVISDGNAKYALLKSTNMESGEQEMLRIYEGQSMIRYKLQNLSIANADFISEDGKQVSLKMFDTPS